MSTAAPKFLVPPPVATPRGALWAADIVLSIADGWRRLARSGAAALPSGPLAPVRTRPDHA